MPKPLIAALIVIFCVLLILLIWFLITGIIFTNISFRRRIDDRDFAKNEGEEAKKDKNRIWYFSQNLTELTLRSYDGLSLKGYYLNNNSNKLAILVHGYHGRYYSVVSQAKIFYENGFDVLSINNRTHDSSEGKLITMGKRESKDLLDWIEFMIKRNSNYQIVLYGISMGGHIVAKTASNINVNEKVKCVVEDCGYFSLKEELIHVTKQSKTPTPKITVFLSDIYSRIFHQFSFTNTLGKTFKNLKIPILMFHGEKDNYVPTSNVNKISSSVPKNIYKEKYIFENCDHTKCVIDQEERYRTLMNNFVNRFIK